MSGAGADSATRAHPQRAELEDGLHTLKLALSPQQVDQLLAYQDLIAQWNKVYNLTALRTPGDMLRQHLLDSLAAVPALRLQLQNLAPEGGARLLDVGSGAGLPGVVFAICCPDLQVSCVDTVGKKTAFIQHAAIQLKLGNLTAVHARVEALNDGRFDIVCSRAFASLVDFTRWSRAALAPQGVWLAMKGKYPAEELALLPPDIQVFHVEQLKVPGLDAERCLLWLRPG